MSWHTNHHAPAVFSSLKTVFSLQGETVTQAKTRDLLRVIHDNHIYYIKRYWTAGKRLRAYCFRSRAKAEWENLLYFKQCGLAAPEVIAYGEERSFLQYHQGAFVMPALHHVESFDVILKRGIDATARRDYLRQIAQGLRRLHDHHFIHGDCFVRNFLVSLQNGVVYFTDCPRGRHMWGPFFNYGRVRDLASFYKELMLWVSLADQLRFFLWYSGEKQLAKTGKCLLRAVIARIS
jgi:tRNA A-37 threonylcarbamoyl transferase component Bud32